MDYSSLDKLQFLELYQSSDWCYKAIGGQAPAVAMQVSVSGRHVMSGLSFCRELIIFILM